MGDRLLTRLSPFALTAAAVAAVALVGFGPGAGKAAAAEPHAAGSVSAAAPGAPADCGPVGPVLIGGQGLANRLLGPLLEGHAR